MREVIVGRQGGQFAPPVFNFTLVPTIKPIELLDNMRSSMARGLPEISLKNAPCAALGETLSIIGGGPSLEDTYKDATGILAAVNGSLSFMLSKGVVPHYCGICDPGPHMVDIIEADRRVTYFVASTVNPAVFDKLKDCNVVLWHTTSVSGATKLLVEKRGDTSLQIGGGCTMGLRWLTLGYTCGFRKFAMHGFDSSFRVDPTRGKATHAYADHQDGNEWLDFYGYQTTPNFIAQVMDYLEWAEIFKDETFDPVQIKMFGDGFLQSKWAEWKKYNPGWYEDGPKPKVTVIAEDFVWPKGDKYAQPNILNDAKNIDQFLAYVSRRGTAVQAGGNVGVYPANLAKTFDYVHTFEPDPENYACLKENIGKVRGNIHAVNAALGERDGTCDVVFTRPDNVGTARVIGQSGQVEMRTIDNLNLPECDLIWLDVEGYEARILEGAAKTVEKFWPVIIIEDNPNTPLSENHGIPAGAAVEWLHSHGYFTAHRNGNDRLFVPSC